MLIVPFLSVALAPSPPPPPFIVRDEVTVTQPLDKDARLSARVDFIEQRPSYTQIRPAIVYSRRDFQVALGTSWINHYENQYAGTRSYLEQRPSLAVRLKQPVTYGAYYEQLEFQLRLYASATGAAQAIPRVLLRYAQAYLTGTGSMSERNHRFNFYEEVAFKFADGSGDLDYERLWTMYQFPLGGAQCEVGVRLQQSIKTSGEPPNFTYGPQIQITIGGS